MKPDIEQGALQYQSFAELDQKFTWRERLRFLPTAVWTWIRYGRK